MVGTDRPYDSARPYDDARPYDGARPFGAGLRTGGLADHERPRAVPRPVRADPQPARQPAAGPCRHHFRTRGDPGETQGYHRVSSQDTGGGGPCAGGAHPAGAGPRGQVLRPHSPGVPVRADRRRGGRAFPAVAAGRGRGGRSARTERAGDDRRRPVRADPERPSRGMGAAAAPAARRLRPGAQTRGADVRAGGGCLSVEPAASVDGAGANHAERGGAMTTGRATGPGAYRRLLAATASANLADGLQVVAVPWLASLLTRDPMQIALVTAATRIPWLLFALPVGAITDRFDRRLLVAWADTARTILLLGFALLLALTGPAADDTGTPPPPHAGRLLVALYALALLVGF